MPTLLLPNVHIIGIQGSGKGTQSSLLVERYGFLYLPSGNLFRLRARQDDAFGRQIAGELSKGHLLPDSLLYHTVVDYLASHSFLHGVLGDGVIRTLQQYRRLQPVWRMKDLDEPVFLHLLLDEKTAYERLLQRSEPAADNVYSGKLGHRSDDNPAAIEERFAVFNQMTEPLIRHLAGGVRYFAVEADQPVQQVHEQLCKALERAYPSLKVGYAPKPGESTVFYPLT